MIQVLHNPRCSKSRAVLLMAEAAADRRGEPLTVRTYLEHPLSRAELETLHAQLGGLPARVLLRHEEAAFVALGHDVSQMRDHEVLDVLAELPGLLQRPVVVCGEKAVIGRPVEAVMGLLG